MNLTLLLSPNAFDIATLSAFECAIEEQLMFDAITTAEIFGPGIAQRR